MKNERNTSLLKSQLRAIHEADSSDEANDPANPISQALTGLMKHGGLYTLTDGEMMRGRMVPLLKARHATAKKASGSEPVLSGEQMDSFVSNMSARAMSFFQHLVTGTEASQLPYAIPSSLMSHIAFPGTTAPLDTAHASTTPPLPPVGQVYNDPTGGAESPEIPAAFTFVGQFVDHDLTMNAVNLFDDQHGPVQNSASPFIDLDSVYGPIDKLGSPSPAIFKNGKFRLRKFGTHRDLRRMPNGTAFIADKRNDENQLILQVHLLVQRTHNKLVKEHGLSLLDAYRETLFNWQSVLVNDYLPRILDGATLTFLLGELNKPDFGDFRYKPLVDLHTPHSYVAKLPHEFAIGFRFGHSQLRSQYKLQPTGNPIVLFNNRLAPQAGPGGNHFDDLRGGQKLLPQRVIDWHFFAGAFKSNRIDGKVTPIVSDLPESAIPDDILFIGNLAHRNLIRSTQVGLCAGEDLADFYGIPRVAPSVIEPDAARHPLYSENGTFRTPLWYYFLKEAEAAGTASQSKLGRLGSRLVGEVILGAVKWNKASYLNEAGWTSKITNTREVTLLNLADYVSSDAADPEEA